MAGITHKFVSAVEDSADETLVRPSDWNDEHDIAQAITDNAPLTVDDASAAADDLCFFTANGISGVAITGATLPDAGKAGRFFCHAPTGRKIVYYDDGSSWIPVISMGTMTVYVDSTDGTDDTAHGTAADASAFKTIQYAVDTIPGLVGGNVIIYVNSETYGEDIAISGKWPTSNYSITIQGTLTLVEDIVSDGNGDKGATSTFPSFYENGMTANEFANLLLKFTSGSNNGLYRVIDSNSNDAGTHKIILGGLTLSAQPVATDTASVYTWGTTVRSITVSNMGATTIYINDVSGAYNTLTPFSVTDSRNVILTRCRENGAAGLGVNAKAGTIYMYQCVLANTGTSGGRAEIGGYLWLTGCKLYGQATTGFGVRIEVGALGYLQGGNIIDGVTKNTQKGVRCIGSSALYCWSPDVNNLIRNCNIAAYTDTGGVITYTTSNSYSGNNTDESATSYGYID